MITPTMILSAIAIPVIVTIIILTISSICLLFDHNTEDIIIVGRETEYDVEQQ